MEFTITRAPCCMQTELPERRTVSSCSMRIISWLYGLGIRYARPLSVLQCGKRSVTSEGSPILQRGNENLLTLWRDSRHGERLSTLRLENGIKSFADISQPSMYYCVAFLRRVPHHTP
jgi:hypothetical protein